MSRRHYRIVSLAAPEISCASVFADSVYENERFWTLLGRGGAFIGEVWKNAAILTTTDNWEPVKGITGEESPAIKAFTQLNDALRSGALKPKIQIRPK